MIDKDLIQKYLRGECHTEEAAQVSTYLRRHPEVVEEILPEEDWNNYLADERTRDFDELAFNEILEATQQYKRKRRIYTSAISVAAAAVLFLGIRYLYQPASQPAQQLSNLEIVQKNETAADRSFRLPDNSLVILSPGSEIKYDNQYNQSNRRIQLKGKAEFSVAKNAQEQFTVECGEITTTALGTRFSVDGNSNAISIMLYEGKVVVKKLMDQSVAKYLSPGDRLNFNIPKNIFELIRETGLASGTPAPKPSTVNKEIKRPDAAEDRTEPAVQTVEKDDNDGHINFQNQNLKTVLSELAERYNVEIDYPTEISTSINVYISVDTTQSIDKILQNIAALNNLGVKKLAEKKFYISK